MKSTVHRPQKSNLVTWSWVGLNTCLCDLQTYLGVIVHLLSTNKTSPIGSMYGILTYMYHKFWPFMHVNIPVTWILWVPVTSTKWPTGPSSTFHVRRQEEAERAHRAEMRLDQTLHELRKVTVNCEAEKRPPQNPIESTDLGDLKKGFIASPVDILSRQFLKRRLPKNPMKWWGDWTIMLFN